MAGVPFNPAMLSAIQAATSVADPAAGGMPIPPRPIIRPDSILGGLLNGPGAMAAPNGAPPAGSAPMPAAPISGATAGGMAPALPVPRPDGLGAGAPGGADMVPMPMPRPAGLEAGSPASGIMGNIGAALSGVQAPEGDKPQKISTPSAPTPSQNIQQGGLEALVQAMMSRPAMANSFGAMLGRQ